MAATNERNISTESSQIEDGLAILADLVADMRVGADRDDSHDVPDDSQDEVEGSTSLQNKRASTSEPYLATDTSDAVAERLRTP
ncbi:MAG: hypothetical protein O3B95_09880 [Chloroflexi bacterium]|nr:hypothetical protein [Chloroflexota bacterium]